MNAKARGKRSESQLGVNSRIGARNFDKLKLQGFFCGEAFSSHNGTHVVTSFGQVLSEIPKKWKTVIV